MKPVTILALAETELRDATSWYRDRDPRVADRFVAEARRTLALIEQFPQIGGRVTGLEHDSSIREMPIHTFPYQVVFARITDRLGVLAFAHNRRNPRTSLVGCAGDKTDFDAVSTATGPANVLSLSRHVPSRAGQTDTRIHEARGAEAPDQRTARGRLL